ncbi:metal ABC transporter ATP-binding protein [Listeria aquatica]|uniref:Zinc ABC transporter ATP-binding protein n=1 Tax=Listeria aquatica FSL S10-1188 TaxID=1265818 RepID=W7ARS1_9LIST|nr:metal ABC transporter ATP-binding protein [Listeria aquatica]EUJ17839.1 zinc ABC transporter ATP-binding protein [Listeria aquatica FSL S10-1188]
MKEAVLQVSNLSFHYDREEVLEGISMDIEKGSFTGLIGPNGSGKSTLLKLILGLLKIQKGTISLFGEDSSEFKEREKIGFVSQKANSFNSAFPATVKEIVASGLTKKKGLFSLLNKQDQREIYEALEKVSMTAFLNRNIGELSGGQQQRVFIARSLVSKPELLILDEPTVGVDARNVQSFYELLRKLNLEEGMTLLLVTHDLLAVSQYVDHVVSLNQKVLFDGSARDYGLYLEDLEMEVTGNNYTEQEGTHCDCHSLSV